MNKILNCFVGPKDDDTPLRFSVASQLSFLHVDPLQWLSVAKEFRVSSPSSNFLKWIYSKYMNFEFLYADINMHRVTANLLYLFLVLGSCGFPLDSNSVMIKDIFNPSKTKRAVLLENEGNATVGYSLQVSIFNNSYKLSGKEIGNTFTVDNNHGSTSIDSSSVNFRWISDDTLVIDFNKDLRTFIQEKSINGVNILYIPR